MCILVPPPPPPSGEWCLNGYLQSIGSHRKVRSWASIHLSHGMGCLKQRDSLVWLETPKLITPSLPPSLPWCYLVLQVKTTSPVPSFPAVVNRLQFTSPHVRKENKNRGSSRFNISQKREIQKLPRLKGKSVQARN